MENWQVLEDTQYYPNYLKAVDDVPAATYRLCFNDRYGLGLELVSGTMDDLYTLPSAEFEKFMREVEAFLKSREKYKKYGFTYKRGAIMYGKPGNGKSMLIELISREIVKKDGITIFVNNVGNINMLVSLLSSIRAKNPSRFIVVVMEELDLLLDQVNHMDRATFLNLLDGGTAIDNVLYLATTNNPDRLTENIYNRPSRFDVRIEVKNPTRETIIAYLQNALHADDLESLNIDKTANDLLGLSLAAVKEFVIGYFVIGNSYEDIIGKLKDFKSVPRNTDGVPAGAGFHRELQLASPVSNGQHKGYHQ